MVAASQPRSDCDTALLTACELIRISARPEILFGADATVLAVSRTLSAECFKRWSSHSHTLLTKLTADLQPGRSLRYDNADVSRLTMPGLEGCLLVQPEAPSSAELDWRRRSHDLRAGVQALLLALDQSDPDESEEAGDANPRADLGNFRQIAAQVMRQIDLTLEPMRNEPSELPVFELTSGLRDLSAALRPNLQEDEARLRLQLPSTPTWVKGDRAALLRLVQNLTLNAGRQSRGGEATVVLRNAPEGNKINIELEFHDNGGGLPPSAIAWLEGREGAETPAPRRDGHGYGLGIIRQLVDDLNGTLRVHNDNGHMIVVRCEMDRAEPPPLAQSPSSLQGLRIWLAEDEPTTAGLIMQLLTRAGAKVTRDESGAGFLARIPHEPFPDMLLCDYGLQDMTGADLTTALRKAGFTGVILGLTGDDGVEVRAESLNAGMNDLMTKPVQPSELVRQLHSLYLLHNTPTPQPEADLGMSLSREIVIDLFDEFGTETAANFMTRAMDQAEKLLSSENLNDYKSLRGPIHSALGACAMTGLSEIDLALRTWQTALRENRSGSNETARLKAALFTTRQEISEILINPVQFFKVWRN